MVKSFNGGESAILRQHLGCFNPEAKNPSPAPSGK
jgi:hypothetical protein